VIRSRKKATTEYILEKRLRRDTLYKKKITKEYILEKNIRRDTQKKKDTKGYTIYQLIQMDTL